MENKDEKKNSSDFNRTQENNIRDDTFQEEFQEDFYDAFLNDSGNRDDHHEFSDSEDDHVSEDYTEDSDVNQILEENEDDAEENDLEDDFDDERFRKEGRAMEISFRIVAGLLIVAICLTSVMALLLATGQMDGLVDTLSNFRSENDEAEPSAAPTPTVRVALTSTPAPDDKKAADSDKAAGSSLTAVPSPVPQNSEQANAGSGESNQTDVMTFHDVDDVVTAKETTNLRNVPSQGEESFIVHILQNGETVNRTGMSDEGWSRLEYDGQVVYAVSSLLTTDLTKKEVTENTANGTDESESGLPAVQTVFTEVNDQVTPKIEVNLRLLPSVTNPKATVVATIKNGEVVTRTGVNEGLGWSRVEYNGQTLYCISSYVETVTPGT